MKKPKFYLIQVIIACFCFALHAQIPENEKTALLALYNSTNGANWTTKWDLSSSVTTWHGIIIKDNHVHEIELNRNNLQGIIPKELADLEKLESLNFALNSLKGQFPEELATLPNIKIIMLEMNDIKGVLPNDFSKCTKLESLTLFNNSLNFLNHSRI